MKRKYFLMILIFLIISVALFADELDSYLNSALNSSSSVKESQLTYDNAMLALQTSNVENRTDITVNTGNIIIIPNSVIFEPAVNVNFPETENNINSAVDLNTSTTYLNGGLSSSTITPGVSVSKTFESDTYQQKEKDNNESIITLSAKQSLETAKYSMCINLLQSIISIEQKQKEIDDTIFQMEKAEKQLEQQMEMGTVTDGSLIYQGYQIQIENSQNSVDIMKWQLENAKENFKNTYGTDYKKPETGRDPDLSFDKMETGNTSCLIAALKLENTKIESEKLNAGDKTSVVLGGGIDTPLTFDSAGYKEAETLLNAYVAVGDKKNYQVSASAVLEWNETSGFSPSVTINGSWNNNNSVSIKDTRDSRKLMVLNKQKVANNEITAYLNYQSELLNYNNSYDSLKKQTDNWKADMKMQNNNASFHKKQFEQKKQMFDIGFATSLEVEEAERIVLSDQIKDLELFLNGRILEYKIILLQL